jgi:hypothetical protein
MIPPPVPSPETPLPSRPPRPRLSRLAVVAFVFALIAFPAGVVAAVRIAGFVFENPGPEAGPWFVVLLISTILGFVAALLGSIPMVRMRGRTPELRGRGLALFAVQGPRALVLGAGLAFGTIWLGGQIRMAHGPAVEEEQIVRTLWLVSAVLVLWYVAAGIRRIRGELRSRTRAWLLYSFGVVLHLALMFGLPFSLVGAFMALHPGQFGVGQERHMPQQPVYAGSYAFRELWFDQPARSSARMTLRKWEKGRAEELGSLTLTGTNRIRWVLTEPGPSGAHTVTWEVVSGAKERGSETIEVPTEVTLVPNDLRTALTLPSRGTTNYWLFVPLGPAGPLAPEAKPDSAIELVLEPAR